MKNKVAIIGAGNVGSTIAYAIMLGRVVREIAIIGRNLDKVKGQVLDLKDGISFTTPVTISAGGYDATKDADVIVIAAGIPRKVGESRTDILDKNISILKGVIHEILKYNKRAILLIVTNPVDILSYAAFRFSGFDSSRVIGSGTALDASRMSGLIGEHFQVNPKNIHAYVIGEHGDSSLPLFSSASIGGMALKEYCLKNSDSLTCITREKLEVFFKKSKETAAEILKDKGSSYYGIGITVKSIIDAIIRNEHTIFCTSNLITDYYGVNDIYLGMPAIINNNGIQLVLTPPLSEDEKIAFVESARKVKGLIKQLAI